MPTVNTNGILSTTRGAVGRQMIAIGWKPKVDACCSSVVRVSQDTECGRRDDGFPCRGMRGGDAGEMGHSSSVSTLPRRLNRGIKAVLCCLLNKFALKMRGTDRVSAIEGNEIGS